MNIGQASQASGVSAKMIRHYEETGLIPAAHRTAAGYRIYSPSDVQMLRFIRRARDLGFPMATISELLSLWRDKGRHSADVKRLATEQIRGLNRKISDLQAMVATLNHLAQACAGDERPDCPILDRLDGTACH
jgi:MerR family gold-responsive transcriptional activator of gol and ges genes